MLSEKRNKQQGKKGKDAAIEKWEAELRSSLASKKSLGIPQALSKQDKDLVETQLRKESDIRRRVSDVHGTVLRGLEFLYGIVDSGVVEFASYLTTILSLLEDTIVKDKWSLFGSHAFESYLVRISFLFSH